MNIKYALALFLLALTACQTQVTPTQTATVTKPLEEKTATQTPPPTATATSSPPPTLTIGPSPTSTLTLTPKPTRPTEGPGPGIVVRGRVTLADGRGVEGVNIHIAFASYAGEIAAATNSNGYYSTGYVFIPGDETIRVWAESAGYSFKPGSGSAAWTGSEFYWRHYHGFEERVLDFIAMEEPLVK